MTAADWLASRTPPPPEALAVRMSTIVAAAANNDDIPEALIAAAEHTLRSLLRLNATDRSGALDLLAADALVTYAFEGATDDPETLERRATAAMRRLSAIVPGP